MTNIVIDTPLYQWDKGRKITITLTKPQVQEVHFARKGENKALPVKPYKNGSKLIADIPDVLLQKATKLNVYLVVGTEDKQYTIYDRALTIIEREKPEDYVYTEEEKMIWADLDERITKLEEDDGGAIAVDPTLTQEGMAADAAAVGKAIDSIPQVFRRMSEIAEPSQYNNILSIDLAQFLEMGSGSYNYYNDCKETISYFKLGDQQFIQTGLSTFTIVVMYTDSQNYNVQVLFRDGSKYFSCLGGELTLFNYSFVESRGLNGAINNAPHVHYTEQSLTEEQKTQARKNIAAMSSDTDTTLTQSGKAADAKAVGDALKSVSTAATVTSVNGQTGDVQLTAENVGAIPMETLEEMFAYLQPSFPVIINEMLGGEYRLSNVTFEEILAQEESGFTPRFMLFPPDTNATDDGYSLRCDGRILSSQGFNANKRFIVDFHRDGKRIVLRISVDGVEEIPVVSAGIPLPPTAEVGQYFKVSAVDDNGNVTAVEAVDSPSGSGEVWRYIGKFETTEEVGRMDVDNDFNGVPLNLKKVLVYAQVKGNTAGVTGWVACYIAGQQMKNNLAGIASLTDAGKGGMWEAEIRENYLIHVRSGISVNSSTAAERFNAGETGFPIADVTNINQVSLGGYQVGVLGVGTYLEIWGVDA